MSEDTVRVRVEAGDYRHEREHYTRGDELEVLEKTLEKHPRSLSRVKESEAAITEDDLDPHPSDLTVDELKERVDDIENPDLLSAIEGAEEATDARSTALDAIGSRKQELLEDGQEE